MARKRKALQHLEYTSQEYWNRLLAQDGLAIDKGRSAKLIPAGSSFDLTIIETMQARRTESRVEPEGSGPDSDE